MAGEGRDRRKFTLWYFFLFLIGVGLILRRDLMELKKAGGREPALEELQAVFTGGVNAGLVAAPVSHYQGVVETAEGPVSAAGVCSARLPPRVKGYVDEINTLVVLDRGGTIRGVKVIAHRETPEYMRRVLESGVLEKLIGKNLRHGRLQLDAVTGATITVRAMREDIAAAAALAGNRLYQLNLPEPDLPSWSAGLTDRRTVAVMIALVVALFARFSPWPTAGRREAAWIVSLLLIGFYAMAPYTLSHTFQLLRLDLPGPANPILALLAAFVLITTFLFGPLHCAYVCPFGALQELLAKLPVRRWRVTPRIMQRARHLRYLILFFCVAGAFGLGIPAFSEAEPFAHLFSRSRDPLAWLFITAVLFFSLFVWRFWCRFLCPTGACLVLLSFHRRWFKRIGHGLADSGIDAADAESSPQEQNSA